MDEFKHLPNQNNVLRVSAALEKIANTIADQKKDPAKKEATIPELSFLKEQCQSANARLSRLSCQTVYSLMLNGTLDSPTVLTMFISMLPSALHQMPIVEGILNILLLELNASLRRLKANGVYRCPFGVKKLQHPLIAVLQNRNVNVVDLAHQLSAICDHPSENVRLNCVEFLRPVFLFVLSNPMRIHDSMAIWNIFMKQQKIDAAKTQELLYEAVRWSRDTPEKCSTQITQLVECIEYFWGTLDRQCAIDLLLNLVALMPAMLEHDQDPRNALRLIVRIVQDDDGAMTGKIHDFLLVSMSQIVHDISPFYLDDAVQVLKTLIKKNAGNLILRNMVLDSLIVRFAINGKSLRGPVIKDFEYLIARILEQNALASKATLTHTGASSVESAALFHPNIVWHLNLVQLSVDICQSVDVNATLATTIATLEKSDKFALEMHLFIRAILLSSTQLGISLDNWKILFDRLISMAKTSANISSDAIYMVLYYLAKEIDAHKQLELLRGLTSFAALKENIAMILNAYRSLTSSACVSLRVLAIDLHTTLWMAESRTYRFLHDILTAGDGTLSKRDQWEMNVAKAKAIKEICTLKASQHGRDLVAPLSHILNKSSNNDLACALAMDGVVLLCKDNVINVTSTWKALRSAFDRKLQYRTIKSLCRFFGQVPLLKSATHDYELLFDEALRRLWQFAIEPNEQSTIEAAFMALRNFDFAELTLKHIPSILYDQIHIPREYQKLVAASLNDPTAEALTVADVLPYIPGECWIQLLQNVESSGRDAAHGFVKHLIGTEVSQYRSGVYMMGDGRPEPKELVHLHARSPLRALVKYIRTQAEQYTEPRTVVQCLECVAHKYSRPIPPMNWFFLIEYINSREKFADSTPAIRFDMLRYALTIAVNQIAHSGSAKNLVGNYLQEFDVDAKDFEETLAILKLVPALGDGVTSAIFAKFLQQTLAFLFQLSSSSHFEQNCHFEQAIAAIVPIFDKKCLLSENVDIVVDEMTRFHEVIDGDAKMYDRYVEHLVKMPTEVIERISSAGDYRKGLAIRAKAAAAQRPLTSSTTNSLMWLNAPIETVIDAMSTDAFEERQELLLRTIAVLLAKWTNETTLCEWIQFFLGRVQFNFSNGTTKSSIELSLFYLDLLMYSMSVAAGCTIFVPTVPSANESMAWINKFPETLWLLSKRTDGWSDAMPRIFEFLYHLSTQQSNLPRKYVAIVGQSLVCVKNHSYFLQKSNWTKFISLKV